MCTSRRCAPAAARCCARTSAARRSRWCMASRDRRSACARSMCRRPTGIASRSTKQTSSSLAKQALTIEEHYGAPMDIEWGKDGATGKIYILQARPETVQSRAGRTILRFTLKARSKVVASGRSIGQRIGAGHARIIRDVKEMSRVRAGDVLVADMTDPDWEPVMKRASAIVTNRGGRTCHAAIIARELGIPAVVGCGTATTAVKEGQAGHGVLRRGRYRIRVRRHARIRSAQHRNGCDAADSGEDHHERRQSRSRVRLRRHSAQRGGSRAPRVHHQPHDRRSSAGTAGIRQAESRTQGHHHANRSPATTGRSISTSTSWPKASHRLPPPSRPSR